VFTLAIVMSLISSIVSLLRGKHYVHDLHGAEAQAAASESPYEAEGDLLLKSADSSTS
jgi:hypothetical protein